jgi:hypothetical protein
VWVISFQKETLIRKMVVSHILGGIGNQMFQYAAGRSLAAALHDEFLLDLESFSGYSLHNGYELKRVFNVPVEAASSKKLLSLLGLRGLPLTKKILRRKQFELFRGKHFVVEPHFNFWPDFFSLKQNSYLHGYWQSEKYFKSIESEIRKELSFKRPLFGENELIANQIAGDNAVSLHVRRGDYLSDAKTSSIMSVCDISYYERAVSYVTNKVASPVFYVFSDDIDWVKQNISVDYPCVYISHNRGEDSYIDMQLMSLCKHHIIANSSFSWWGAWLNASQTKIVVAPNFWFKNDMDDSDLIPTEWFRM